MAYFNIVALLAAILVFSDVVQQAHGQTDSKSPLTIKVLDAVRGIPAAKLRVKLLKQKEDKTWDQLNSVLTCPEGEVRNLTTEKQYVEGIYKVQFLTKPFWSKLGLSPFHEYVDVVFTANDAGHRHYTIAVLLTPYSISTTAMVSEEQEDHV